MVMFDSCSLVINPNPYDFGIGLLPPTTFIRTPADQPTPEDSLEWYQYGEDMADISDPADWDDDEVEARYQDWIAREGHGGFLGHSA